MAFQAGYAEVNINPNLGCFVYGYYIDRFAEGFLDDLMASALEHARLTGTVVDMAEYRKSLK